MAAGFVHSVNAGGVRTVDYNGKPVQTGIFKQPAHTRLHVEGVNVEGDDQADRSVHGGEARAVYAYALEDYAWWQRELHRDLPPAQFGENITTRNIDVSGALVGERWRVGSAVLQVTTPRFPCFKLGMKMGDAGFVKRFADALRPGTYCSIVSKGDVAAGDEIQIVSRPPHGLSIAMMTQIYLFERNRLHELLVPDLPDEWRDWVMKHIP